VNAGPDLTTNPGDTTTLSATFGVRPTDAPWPTRSTGVKHLDHGQHADSDGADSAAHVLLRRWARTAARVSVRTAARASDVDTVAVKVVAPYVWSAPGTRDAPGTRIRLTREA